MGPAVKVPDPKTLNTTIPDLKILSPATHGPLDYLFAIFLFVAPTLFAFFDTATILAYTFGAGYILAATLTLYPLGVVRLLSFPMHGILELIMALFWIACPWLFNFANDIAGRNFFVAAGVVLLVVVALTDYEGSTTGTRDKLS